MTTAIPVSASLAGRIADDPRLRETSAGTLYVRIRVQVFPPRARHSDAPAHRPEPVTVELVGIDTVAEILHRRFRFGDWFVATGRLQTSRNGTESFIARRVGHDATRTNYTLPRSRTYAKRRRHAASSQQPTNRGPVSDHSTEDRTT